MKVKNSDLEMLRAVGIIFVMLAHAYKLTPWQGSFDGSLHYLYYYFGLWTGVDLFFCVSGFIITKNILDKELEFFGKKDIKSFVSFAFPFWLKRAYRLWPTAFIWLTIVTVLSFIFNKSNAFGNPINQILYQIYAMFDVANFYGYQCVVSSVGFKACGVYQVFWSLSLEEQFYLIFPFIIFFCGKRFTFFISALFFLIQAPLDRGGSFLGFIRTDSICLGIMIAIISTQKWYNLTRPKSLSNKFISIPLFSFFVISLALLGSYKTIPVGFSTGMVAILSGILVWISSYDKSYLTINGMIGNIMLWIGSRSYSLYVVHIPSYYLIVEITHRVAGENILKVHHITALMLTSGFLLSTLLAELTFRLIEDPIRQVGRDRAEAIKGEIRNSK